MATITKFGFDTDFDAPPPRPAAEPAAAPPPPPMFTEAELDAARASAFAEGREAGRHDAEATTERRAADALSAIAAALADTGAAHARALDEARVGALRLAAAIARRLMPALLRQNAVTVVESLVGEILPRLVDEPRLVIRTSGALVDALKPRLDETARQCGYCGHVILLGDDRLSGADCRIEWADGGAERDTERLLGEVETLVDRFLHGAGADPSAPAPETPDTSEETFHD